MKLRTSVLLAMGLVAGSLLLTSVARADTITVNPGQQLIITFTVSPDPTLAYLGPINVLDFYLSGTGWYGASVALYNGTTLLGTLSNSFGDPSFAFTASGSEFTFEAGVLADFTSIANGSIQGTLALDPRGSATFNTDWSSNDLGHAIDASGYYIVGSVNISSEQIGSPPSAVPEPTSLLLLGSGLMGIAGVARKRLRK